MVLKLHGSPGSPWVRLVVAVLREKEVPFELVLVDFANREHKSPEFLTKQPFGQIPYIVCESLTTNSRLKTYLWNLNRMMMALFSTKAKLLLTISRPSTATKEHRSFQ